MAGIYKKSMNPDEACRAFIGDLFDSGLINHALLPARKSGMNQIFPALVSSKDSLASTFPFAPVMPLSTAVQLSKITRFASPAGPLAVLLKPCESRAAVELFKLRQINLENIVLITRDCLGTVSPKTFELKIKDSGLPSFSDFSEDELRPNCRMCEYPESPVSDINIGTIGVEGLMLDAKTEKGSGILSKIKFEAELSDLSARDKALKAEKSKRTAYAEKNMSMLRSEISGIEGLVKFFADCVNCHNCRTMCPVCYCNECFFDSSTFHFEGSRYEEWSSRRGILQMPRDELLFHLGRMNHIGLSCVACGMCEQACPHDIRVGQLFTLISATAQKEMDIHAGLSLTDPLPLATYREDEFCEMGEEKA
ncbi:(Fe-S)-binding protein [bacterium]|nr:(Fe-S)-binding protein [bacterium]